jgi:mono/diheme cytochrome c family protein
VTVVASVWTWLEWKNDVRHWLILLNIIVLVALVIYLIRTVLSPKRAREVEKTPANLTPFVDDDTLEGRRLERVQGWALMFAAIVAVALPIYWLREPGRQHDMAADKYRESVARGATLFANKQMPAYDAAVSRLCADCHGTKGEGGSTSTHVNGVQVNWKVPPLNTEYLRFTEDPACLDPSLRQPNTICEMTDIITYGRPGTPMQPQGVEGGGPLNDQGVADLVAYIESIQLTPQASQAQAAQQLAAAKQAPSQQVTAARQTLATDQQALAKATTDAAKTLGVSEAEVPARCKAVIDAVNKKQPYKREEAIACGTYTDAAMKVATDKANLAWAIEWEKRRTNVSDGQLLFELNCARCHTQGWSIFDPTAPPGTPGSVDVLGLAGGGGGTGGGIGFNLRGGDEERRFGADVDGGFQASVDFVSKGSDPFVAYGNSGVGSGRMPGFGQMLTQDQIAEIVYYERYCLEATNFKGQSAPCPTKTTSKEPATTTTIPVTTTSAGG